MSLARRRQAWLGRDRRARRRAAGRRRRGPAAVRRARPGPTFNVDRRVSAAARHRDQRDAHLPHRRPPRHDHGQRARRTRAPACSPWAAGRRLGRSRRSAVLPREALYPDDELGDAEVKARERPRLLRQRRPTRSPPRCPTSTAPFDDVSIVSSVSDGSPADGKLEPGDEICSVDDDEDRPTLDDVAAAMSAVSRPGDAVTVRLTRAAAARGTTSTSSPRPRRCDPDRAFLGITSG